jgi:hypothetical protein
MERAGYVAPKGKMRNVYKMGDRGVDERIIIKNGCSRNSV